MLKTADPTVLGNEKKKKKNSGIRTSELLFNAHYLPMVPMPISPSVIKVPITFTNNSGALVAAAINVAPATSFDIFRAIENGRIDS